MQAKSTLLLKNGTFKAYKRGTSWYYVDKRGIKKRCGKHKCLKDDILLTPLSSENKAIAKEFVDSLTLNDYSVSATAAAATSGDRGAAGDP